MTRGRGPAAPGWRALLAVLVVVAAIAGCDRLFQPASPGERLYRQRCARCHGRDGRGNTPRYMGDPYADLRDATWKTGGDPITMENVIREGIFAKMPDNQDLSEAEIRQIVDYVLALRGETR